MNAVHEAAIEYASLGLRVIPLKPNSKEPSIPQWPEKASKSPKVIAGWFGDHPEANLGLATGYGLTCLDIDPAKGGEESFRSLMSGRELPDTMEALTGGNGRHLGLTTPRPIGNLVNVMPGLDVRGVHGQVVAYPSIHPITGRRYEWKRHPSCGIAPAPDWLIDRLTAERSSVVIEESPMQPYRPLPDEGGRLGDEDVLLAEMIFKFPVAGFGQRNDRMMRAIASLVGRGFSDAITIQVVRRWWEFYYDRRLVCTHPREAPTAIRQTIRSIRRSSNFRVALGPNHLALCLEIKLSDEQRRLLGAEVSELYRLKRELNPSDQTEEENPGEAQPNTNHKSLTLIRRRLSDSLCQTDHESAFVEAVLVHATYQLRKKPGELLKMTADQIRGIVSHHHPETSWDDKQMDRLKAKYLWRVGKPATRFELLREVVKGHRGCHGTAGTPSEYLLTGVRVLLAAE